MFGWIEIFISLDKSEALKVCRRLQDHAIPSKIKWDNNSTRLSMNNIDGTRVSLSRGGPGKVNDFYHVLVKRKFKEEAKRFI